MEKKENGLEEIHWDDAYHLTANWASLDEIAEKYKEGAFRVVNVGWVLFEDKKYVIISSKRNINYEDYGFIMMIPKGMITKRIKL